MRLSPAKFNKHLDFMGQDFYWRRGYACPCVSRETGQPAQNCAQCKGLGRTWPGAATQGRAGVVSQSRLRNYSQFGPWDSDDMLLSLPSDSVLYEIGQFDRVEAIHRTEPFSLALVRGLNDVIEFPVHSVDRVFYLNDQEQPVEVGLPVVNADGSLTWSNGAPPAHKSFSISGRRFPEYYCYLVLPTDRPMHGGEPLPRRVVLRRFSLFNQ